MDNGVRIIVNRCVSARQVKQGFTFTTPVQIRLHQRQFSFCTMDTPLPRSDRSIQQSSPTCFAQSLFGNVRLGMRCVGMTVKIQVKKPLTHSLRIAVAIIVIFLCIGLLARFTNRQGGGSHETGWQVYFSPGGGCADAIVQTIAQAKDSIFVQAYSFTSQPIAKALADAKKRGVTISIILDKDQQTDQYSEANFLNHSDVRTLIDGEHAMNHNKVMVIDGETV